MVAHDPRFGGRAVRGPTCCRRRVACWAGRPSPAPAPWLALAYGALVGMPASGSIVLVIRNRSRSGCDARSASSRRRFRFACSAQRSASRWPRCNTCDARPRMVFRCGGRCGGEARRGADREWGIRCGRSINALLGPWLIVAPKFLGPDWVTSGQIVGPLILASALTAAWERPACLTPARLPWRRLAAHRAVVHPADGPAAPEQPGGRGAPHSVLVGAPERPWRYCGGWGCAIGAQGATGRTRSRYHGIRCR